MCECLCEHQHHGNVQVFLSAARDFSPRVNFQCRLSYGVRTASRVQPHSPTPVSTLKVPNIGSHTIVWTHENTEKWVALFLWLLCLTQVRRPEFPSRDNEVLINKNKTEKQALTRLCLVYNYACSNTLKWGDDGGIKVYHVDSIHRHGV